jgi:YD repeat-containing protein
MLGVDVALPSSSTRWIRRPHLLDALRLSANHTLTLVCAPPGYGKTTLLTQFLHAASFPVCWLSLFCHLKTKAPLSGTIPLTVSPLGTNLSSGATGYQWDLGDGAVSTTTHPVHAYNQAGHYTVALTATAGAGSDTEVKVDYITANAAGGATPITRTIVYTYDGLYRLTRAGYSTNESFQYAYDAAGNMTAMTTTLTSTLVTTKSYDAANPVERDELPAHHRHHGRRAPHTGVERRRRTLAGRGRYLSMGRRRAPDPGDGGGGDKPLCLPG